MSDFKQGDAVLYRGRPMHVTLVYPEGFVALYDDIDLADYEKVRASEVIPTKDMKAREIGMATLRQKVALAQELGGEISGLVGRWGF